MLLIYDPMLDTEDTACSVRTLLQAGAAEIFTDFHSFMAQPVNIYIYLYLYLYLYIYTTKPMNTLKKRMPLRHAHAHLNKVIHALRWFFSLS